MTAIATCAIPAVPTAEFRQRHLCLYSAPDQVLDLQGSMDDETLDRQFSSGDPALLRHAYDRYGSLVFTFCRKTVGAHLAEDVSQEVFVAAWNSRARFDPDRAPLGAWLIGIARNKVVDTLRREGRQPLPSEDRHDQAEIGASEGLADKLLVADALAHLPERARAMVELSFFGGLTHGEIAERTHTPLGTVKSDIRRALSRLRTLVEDPPAMADDPKGDDLHDVLHLRHILGSLTDEDRKFDQPPDGLWDRIAAVTDGATELGEPAQDQPGQVSRPEHLAEVVPLTPRGRWGLAFIAGAAALVALVVSFAAWRAVSNEDDITIIASVPITSDGLDTSSSLSGRAELIEEDGVLFVRLDVDDLPAPNGYIEAWLIDSEVQGMYPLGAVTGDIRLPVPHGVEPSDFPIIDLSVEPLDGDPTHSGVSILRGQLPF